MKLLLVDGNAVLHRAYYALPDWRNRSGEATAGVYGFLSMLVKVIGDLKPTHLGVVFDCPEPTFRHEMYVGYQTNREKERQVSEDIWGQVEKLKVVFEKMGVPVFFVPGFEADDVIGTLAEQSIRAGERESMSEVIIITGDRDLMQLVNKRTKLYMPVKGMTDMVMVDENKVLEKMGVHPKQIVDYKALVGDSSDNYPGAAGIGPKTAIHLLGEFGSLEKIYEFVSKHQITNYKSQTNIKLQIPISTVNKLINGYEGAMLSQKLATIRMDAPVTWKSEGAEVPNEEKMAQVFRELGYKSLLKRVEPVRQAQDKGQSKLF